MKHRTNDLAKILGVTTNTIRRYEKNGYITPSKTESGYREYSTGDILRIAHIRLLRKCGFSHTELEIFRNKTADEIKELAQNKLDIIDRELERLKHLRHWLKDNIQLLDTCKNIGGGFVTMVCPALRYVLCSENDKLYSEKERLKTISEFMYNAEEVQIMFLERAEDIKAGRSIMRIGWAIKEMDIERLDLYEMINSNKYIEIYPQQKCMYGTLQFPSQYIDDPEKRAPYTADFNKRKDEYLAENHLTENGDIVLFFLGAIGANTDFLVCIPVTEKA